MKTAHNLWRDLLRQVRLFPLALLILTALPLTAQVPSLINYQGRLTDGSGNPMSGNRTMAVSVYDAASGGNLTYSESLGTVSVANGTYSFQFGASGNGIVSTLSGQDYLALTVNGTEETTRTRLLAVPYALKALKANESMDAQALQARLLTLGVMVDSNFVSVQGGTLPEASGLAGQTVATFQIGKYEVTWGEWKEVRDWAVANGYSDLAGVGDTYPSGSADNFPVCNVSWYDIAKWSNAKSEKEGLTPVYQVSGATYKTGQSVPTVNSGANGYRLPTEKEWEWAARGGTSSQGYTYSGSNDANAVAWFNSNSGNGSNAVGTKAANELGISDMSGNIFEWCEDVVSNSYRRIRGGSWGSGADYCSVALRVSSSSDNRNNSIGFRLARSEAAQALAQKVSALEVQSSELATNVQAVAQTLTSNMTAVQAQTQSASESLTALQAQISTLTSNLTAMQSQVASMSANLTAVQSQSGSVDAQQLKAELVAASILPGGGAPSMITVQGGTLPQSSGLAGQIVATFQIGKYEVTWGEWQEVRAWAFMNGYSDFAGVGGTYPAGAADNFPVSYVNWYDIAKWCNAKSEKEGLVPVYQVGGATYKTGESVPTVNSGANGYRLPTEAEWEWAARGGASSQGYTYSGSNEVNAVARYYINTVTGAKGVGTKAANELGIYDMSGNLWEWCWNVYDPSPSSRCLRGGSWGEDTLSCTVDSRYFSNPAYRDPGSNGFRLARSSGN